MMRGCLLAGALFVASGCGPKVIGDPDAGPVEVCVAGTNEACYSGPVGTQGVGPCVGGTRVCGSDGQWGPCTGEVVPAGEVCGNAVDDNCSGAVDEEIDQDGDGFTNCGGDCCDSTNEGCQSPELVNPGAFEAPGNQLDDDCDGTADNILAANCDTGLASSSGNGLDYAAAMDLCQTATENPGDTQWGVISATFTRADGTGVPNAEQRAIRSEFGSTLVQSGAAFAVLSTGAAATPNQTNPAHRDFQRSTAVGTSSGFPTGYLAANGGTLPNVMGCPELEAGSAAQDPVMLTLRIRTPTNAKSFSFSMNFLSSEFPEWVCSPFNDFFVALLDSTFSGSPANPADKNLAFYTSPQNQIFPIGVNLAFGDTGLFQQCLDGATGCGLSAVPDTTTACANAVGELAGTGMDIVNPGPQPLFGDEPGVCGANNLLGGGTGWLTTTGNVVGGEIITLRIALWDTTDGFYDSLAIVDNFQWSVEASQPGTVLQKPKH